MKKFLLCCSMLILLIGCTPEGIISGYPQSKLNELLVEKNLEDEGHYGICKFYVPPQEKITEKLPLVVYFDSKEHDDGVNSIIEYVDKEENPAIVIIVPYGTNDYERALISQGVEDYVTSKAKDSSSAIDPTRIYVTGFGSGAFEAWCFALENPELVSTFAPVCGGPPSGKSYKDPDVPVVMMEMNIWVVQYVDDPLINNDFSKKVVTAIWTQNLSLCRYTEFFDGGHTTAPFKQRSFLDWIFGTRRVSSTKGGNHP